MEVGGEGFDQVCGLPVVGFEGFAEVSFEGLFTEAVDGVDGGA